MSYLTLNDVSFDYPNGFKALDGVNMSFDKGESVAIVGQNGAGKTTAVKLMNGLIKPKGGEVIVDSWNTKDYTTAQLSKKVGYVFQNPDDQIFHGTVYSEVEFGPKNLKLSSEEIEHNVKKSIKLADLEDFSEENPHNLPYSTRKFVSIASVIAMNPEVIILDEPTAGQDQVSMERLRTILDYLVSEGKIVITITHDMEFVIQNFERVIVMANKKKIADGNKRDIYWDFDILEKGMIKQPYLSSVGYALELEGNPLNIGEMIKSLEHAKSRFELA